MLSGSRRERKSAFRDLRSRQIVDHPAGAVTREFGAPTLGLRGSELHRALFDAIGEIVQQLEIFPPGTRPAFLLRAVIGIQRLSGVR